MFYRFVRMRGDRNIVFLMSSGDIDTKINRIFETAKCKNSKSHGN